VGDRGCGIVIIPFAKERSSRLGVDRRASPGRGRGGTSIPAMRTSRPSEVRKPRPSTTERTRAVWAEPNARALTEEGDAVAESACTAVCAGVLARPSARSVCSSACAQCGAVRIIRSSHARNRLAIRRQDRLRRGRIDCAGRQCNRVRRLCDTADPQSRSWSMLPLARTGDELQIACT